MRRSKERKTCFFSSWAIRACTVFRDSPSFWARATTVRRGSRAMAESRRVSVPSKGCIMRKISTVAGRPDSA